MHKVAYIIDGGFLTKKYQNLYRRFPSADDVEDLVFKIQKYINSNPFEDGVVLNEIYRVFYYDCRPLTMQITNPLDGNVIDLSTSKSCKNNMELQEELTRKNFFALRYGELQIFEGEWDKWQVKPSSLKHLTRRHLDTQDLVPNIHQKGVDMRMGLDIASLTSKKLVTRMVLMSADSDMIPAMKMARKEGVQVFLHTFDKTVKNNMAEHCDIIIYNHELSPKRHPAKH